MTEIDFGLVQSMQNHPPGIANAHARRTRPEPRLDGRPHRVSHDLGVRILPSTRALLDRLQDQHHLTEAEIGRVLLASGFFVGRSRRARVATALCTNSAMHTFAAASRIAEALRSDIERLSASVTKTTIVPSPQAEHPELGPRDPTLLRVRLDDSLHRRLRLLVDVYVLFRRDREIPTGDDAAKRRLVQHLAARTPAEVARERSPLAEVVRWALAQAESDVDELLAEYVRGRAVLFRRIERAIDAMRLGARDELAAALGEAR